VRSGASRDGAKVSERTRIDDRSEVASAAEDAVDATEDDVTM
jgi:hypothetical protein